MVEDAAYSFEHDWEGSPYRALARSVEGSGLRLLGEPDRARRALEDGLTRGALVKGSITTCLSELALLAIDDDDWSEARRRIERAVEVSVESDLTERPPQSIVFAISALVHAHRGATDAAHIDANRARILVSRLNYAMPWMPIEVRLVLARVELILGDAAAAGVLTSEAEDLLARFPDAGILTEQREQIARAVQAASGQVGRGVVPLTTAELRVLRYLPTHLSFQAIAEELFVSRNTVKTQAIAIYRKLGVSSRGEAVERAVELALLER
jgi:LuxR family maltose regulon positive regulatory protein